eukprot:gene3599-biopygen10429
MHPLLEPFAAARPPAVCIKGNAPVLARAGSARCAAAVRGAAVVAPPRPPPPVLPGGRREAARDEEQHAVHALAGHVGLGVEQVVRAREGALVEQVAQLPAAQRKGGDDAEWAACV